MPHLPLEEKQNERRRSVAAPFHLYAKSNKRPIVSGAAAVILGIVGLTRPSGKVMAIVGLILGAIALIGGLVWDIIMLPVTFGMGFFF